ncbi:hypothetical protein NE237_023379 [Protea cynaroides]|uniref:CCHC-type domain-containing protein n=1 Tax=Protea cynaroides TaxID=273540 RepID=A0A9Q0K638_9MAGN|nr:hypothetical protein NE237_023379 [Protea cynaroides]
MENGSPKPSEVMVECVFFGIRCFFKQLTEYEEHPIRCAKCGNFGHQSDSCPNEVSEPAFNKNVQEQPRRSGNFRLSRDVGQNQDHLRTDPPVNLSVPINLREDPSSANISGLNTDLGRWADVEDSKDEDEIEEEEIQPNEMIQPDVPSYGLQPAQPLVENVDKSNRGLSQMVSLGIIIASIYDNILAMDEALQAAAEAFTEMGKRHRGRTVGRGNSHWVDTGQTSRVNFEEIAAIVVGNQKQDVRSVTFSTKVIRSRRGAG